MVLVGCMDKKRCIATSLMDRAPQISLAGNGQSELALESHMALPDGRWRNAHLVSAWGVR
jgi:hypothetical protein